MGRPQGRHLEGRANATADPGARCQPGQARHVGLDGVVYRQFAGKALGVPAGEHGDGQQGGGAQAGGPGTLQGPGLGRSKRLAAGAAMDGDQLGAQASGAAAGAGHGGRNVVELEIEEHPQAPLAQLGHHLGPSCAEQL